MALIIQKFGGTSVANIDRIKEVTQLIKFEKEKNNRVIVVVSAMAGATNHLITLCNEVSKLITPSQLAECDAALSSGEMIAASLVALSLQEKNIKARSVFAWQLPILTDNNYGRALVKSVSNKLLKNCLSQDIVPIIAGFQGIDDHNRLSTLGRGGSDTTASLIAASMQADRCDIYTDVEGVFTADPRIIHTAKKISEMSFEEMLELATNGAKVLHPRCIEIARRYNVPMRVLSSFTSGAGTLITSRDKIMENRVLTGIAFTKNLLKISIKNPTISFFDICNLLVTNQINIEVMENIDQNYVFICSLTEQNKAQYLLDKLKLSKQIENFNLNSEIAVVSIIGHGVKGDLILLSKILSILEESNIIIKMLNISEIKVSILVQEQDAEKAVSSLHKLIEEEG